MTSATRLKEGREEQLRYMFPESWREKVVELTARNFRDPCSKVIDRSRIRVDIAAMLEHQSSGSATLTPARRK